MEEDNFLYSIDFVKLITEFKNGIVVKDRKYLLKKYKTCFIGSEAVKWLITKKWASSINEAEIIGNILIKINIFSHVTNAHSFSNKHYFYKFTDDTPNDSRKLFQYRFEEVVQLVKNVSWMATIRSIDSKQIKLLQIYEGLFCCDTERSNMDFILKKIKDNPHDNIIPLDFWDLVKNECIFVYPVVKGLSLLPGLYRYYNIHKDNNNCLFLYNMIRNIMKQVITALLHLHSIGIGLGRLIPSNILFTEDTCDCKNIKITGIGYSIATQFYRGIYIKDCNLLPPDLNPLKQNNIKLKLNENVTSQEILSSIGPFKFNPCDDAWSIGNLLSILLFGDNCIPLWDIRDRYSLIDESLVSMSSCDEYLLTKDSQDLITQLLDVDKAKRISLTEVLAHPYFTKSDKELLSMNKNWNIASSDIVRRWKYIWPKFHQQTVSLPNTVVSVLSKFKQIPFLKHISSPFITFDSEVNNNMKRVIIFSYTMEHVDTFMSKLTAEYYTCTHPSSRNESYQKLLTENTPLKIESNLHSLSNDSKEIKNTCTGISIQNDIYYTFNDNVYHFSKLFENEYIYSPNSSGEYDFYFQFLHSDFVLFICNFENDHSLEKLSTRLHSITKNSSYRFINRIKLVVVMIGWSNQNLDSIEQAFQSYPYIKILSLTKDNNFILPLIIKTLENFSIEEEETVTIYNKQHSLQVFGNNNYIDIKSFGRIIEYIMNSKGSLKILDFRCCKFKDSQWNDIIYHLPFLLAKGLYHLQFSSSPSFDCSKILDILSILAVQSYPNFRILILTKVNICINCVQYISQYIVKRDCFLNVLDISDNNLIDEGSISILEAVALNNSITTLRMSNVYMGSIGAQYVALLLERNISIVYLDISHNPIGPLSITSFETVLTLSSHYNICYFYYNYSLTNVNHHKVIQEKLSYNKSIKHGDNNIFLVKNNISNNYTVYYTNIPSADYKISISNIKCKQQNYINTIVLSSLNLETLPIFIDTDFPTLESLNLSNNRLKEYNISELIAKKLKQLDLSFNYLTNIPLCISKHKNLEILLIQRNEISNANGIKYLQHLTNLKYLDLSGNWINSIPLHTLSDFPKLEKIRLLYNTMHIVKVLIYEAYFMRLNYLDLSSKDIDSLPNDFIYLNKYLKILNLARNRFSSIPPQLRNLSNIKKIIIKQNNFKSVHDIYLGGNTENKPKLLISPSEFNNTGKRKSVSRTQQMSISLVRNVFTTVPGRSNSIFQDDTVDIKDALYCQRKTIKQKIYQLVKILHIGEQNIFTSYLFKNIHKIDNIVNIEDTIPHIEEDIKLLPFHYCNCISGEKHQTFRNINFELIEDESKSFSMWNFCGPNVIPLKFFRNLSAIYILYFDRSKSIENQIMQSLQIIHATCKSPYIILVGYLQVSKKTDKLPIPLQQLTNELDNIKANGFLSISYLLILETNKESISQLLEYILKLANDNKDLLQNVNTQDKELIDLIERESKYTMPPIISNNELSTMAHSCEILNYNEAKPIIRYLNSIGRVLYIDDQKLGLTDIVILCRNWIVNACNELYSTSIPNGILPLSEIRNVWKPPCFPAYILDNIIALLVKNEIVCQLSLPNHPPSLLIPCMLDEQKPVIFDVWPSLQDYIHFKDLYLHPQPELGRTLSFPQAAPFDFFSRLLFRLFHVANAIRYWKSGIIIEKHGHLCLIENYTENTIHFRFRSKEPSNTVLVSRFIRIVMETTQQLLNIYRIPHKLSVSYMCPSIGINTYFYTTEISIFQNLVKGIKFIKGKEIDENILYSDIAPDILLCDMDNFQINMDDVTIEKPVGKGSYGTVYSGTFKNKKVAIKELTVNSHSTMEAFSREVWMSACLKHPTIAELIGFSWKPLSLILEYIPYGDLYEYISDETIVIEWPLRLKIIYDIASAMKYLHTRDPIIIHRDLKTPNCLIAGFKADDITVKVTDLGESVVLAESYSGRDNLQNPVWMAPEILRNEAYDHLSDVYSFGIILWELLVRKFPFDEYPVGRSSFKAQLEDAIIDGLRPTIPTNCPKLYSDLIRMCWQNNPQKRPNFTTIVDLIQTMIDMKISE